MMTGNPLRGWTLLRYGCSDHDGFVRHNQGAAVAAATVADEAGSALLADLLGQVAGCFPRRETRQSCSQMLSGLLMELDDHNCWTIAEAIGHRGPHRLQHLCPVRSGTTSRSWTSRRRGPPVTSMTGTRC